MPSIECTLHGNLEDNLPEGLQDNRVTLNFATMPSVDEIISALKIDRENVQFALANGQYIDFEQWSKPITATRIQIWPRISGG